ncbi:hypothetical protein CLOSTHATH_03647 [Hungatella hathewayi DSM 13479]|uniref:Uncharacterized protein n=1 Tax=Hungatella hathewayi DSM 13479 TaxID=566550 RepID=D3AJ57_9FIRM|nr:hypothetical protein CLOSTHATH_03647 [Hungatella hathewayi DSM 13479]
MKKRKMRYDNTIKVLFCNVVIQPSETGGPGRKRAGICGGSGKMKIP